MSSTSAKMTEAAAPAFSYAQAAKGISPKAEDSSSNAEDMKPSINSDATLPRSTDTSNEQHVNGSSADPAVDSDYQSRAVNGVSKATASSTTSPSLGSASVTTLAKDEEMVSPPNGTSEGNWDKKSEASGKSAKQTKAERKASKMEKGWRKEAEPVPELKVAPIPTVNIWQQRMEIAKADAATKPAPKASPKSTLETPKPAPKKKSGSPESNDASAPKDAAKKPAVRSSRQTPKDLDLTVLPPVGDDTAWPTPETARDDEKKTPVEKSERSSGPTKPHGKEKWVPVPYVPTAVFSTPLPNSSSKKTTRPTRGGREGHGRGAYGGQNGDRASQSTSKDNVNSEQPASADSTNAQKPSRTEAETSSKPEARAFVPQAAEKIKSDTKSSKNSSEHHTTAVDKAAAGSITAADGTSKSKFEGRSFHRNNDFNPSARFEGSNRQFGSGETNGFPRQNGFERHHEGSSRSNDFHKDSSHVSRDREFNKDREGNRERGEPRAERGRGGYRGRGGHAAYGSSNPHFSGQPVQNSAYSSKPFQFNDRQRQSSQPNHSGPPRTSVRTQSIPNQATFHSYAPLAQPISPIHPEMSMFAYPPMQPMMMPYSPVVDQYPIVNMLSMQLEYYFSVDNLCKDIFMRQHMDSQGYLPLSVIASFRRVKSLTENVDLLRDVCQNLRSVEFWPAADGNDKLRKREDWETWVLSMDQRDPAAQVDGPPPRAQANGYYQNGSAGPKVVNGNGVHVDTNAESAVNGISKDESTVGHSALSSEAPEFSPLSHSVNEEHDAFPDDQIENLVIVVRKPGYSSPSMSPSSGPRNVSNGVADAEKTPDAAEEAPLEKSENKPTSDAATNGTTTPKKKSSMPTFWVKDRDAPTDLLPSNLTHESYNVFRVKALNNRPLAANKDCHKDMDVLYQFWSHFLVRNFNSSMYNEFHRLALDDLSTRECLAGFYNLVRFYEAALMGPLVVTQEVAQDYVNIVHTEPENTNRYAFQKLRAVWRDGAFNLKNRKKVDSALDTALKAELDQ